MSRSAFCAVDSGLDGLLPRLIPEIGYSCIVFEGKQDLEKNEYQKVSGSRKIGPHLNLTNHRSNSFRVFVEGIRRFIEETT